MTFSCDNNMFFRVAPEMPGRISGRTKTSVYVFVVADLGNVSGTTNTCFDVFVVAGRKEHFSRDNNMNLCFCRA